MSRIFGIIGNPLAHSFSPQFFQNKFAEEKISDAQFFPFPIAKIEDFLQLIATQKTLCGLAVTIPYKEAILPYLDLIDPCASEVGAVNCIAFHRANNKLQLIGYNTDIIGFEKMLISANISSQNRALILGTGGASKAVAFVLHKMQIPFQFVSRKKTDYNLTYSDLTAEIIQRNSLIINATPVGMFPDVAEKPLVPYHFLSSHHTLIDLIYNPLKTSFLQEGEKYRAHVMNGIQMLYFQAEENWKIWNNSTVKI